MNIITNATLPGKNRDFDTTDSFVPKFVEAGVCSSVSVELGKP
jgi:hypothetical protein